MRLIALAALLVLASPALAQGPSVTRVAGPTMTKSLGAMYELTNGSSTLQQEWVALTDPASPVAFEGVPGVRVETDSDSPIRGMIYTSEFKLVAREPLSSVEIKFLTIDIWGEPMRTLVATYVADIGTTKPKKFSPQWSTLGDRSPPSLYASIAYVARARTAAGVIYRADHEAVLTEARKISDKFTATDLEPFPEPK